MCHCRIQAAVLDAHALTVCEVCLLQHGMPVAPPTAPSIAQARAQQVPGQWAAPEEERVSYFETELEINDFPQHARWKVRSCFLSGPLC